MRNVFLLLLTIGLVFVITFGAYQPVRSNPRTCPTDLSLSWPGRITSESIDNLKFADQHLLEVGHAAKLRAGPESPSEIKIVSYNIRWRAGEDLRKLARLFRDGAEISGAAILGLQEVDRNRKRTGNINTVGALADELGMHYAWAAPPTTEREEETGVAILSSYPLTDVHRIVLPHKGPGGRRRVALGATVTVGRAQLRVYSVHSETRLATEKKVDQMRAVLADLAHYRKDIPAIVLGDLNTWEPEAVAKTFKFFIAEGFHTPFGDQPTFFRRVMFVSIDLKLDWIWLRHLKATKHGIDQEIGLSDHWPLWVIVSMETARPDKEMSDLKNTPDLSGVLK